MSIRDNLQRVRESLETAILDAGRKIEEVELMAVSKTKPLEMMLEAYEAGQRLFGENRVMEAEEKSKQLPADARLEMIGHLQSNKIKHAVGTFSCVQTVDSVRLAEKLNARCELDGCEVEILLQLKTSDELTKTGLTSYETLAETAAALDSLSKLRVRGLMTIAPFTDDEKTVREAFSDCREARDRLSREFPALDLKTLSMGMSSDFHLAVMEGSTLVRIGSAIFGVR